MTKKLLLVVLLLGLAVDLSAAEAEGQIDWYNPVSLGFLPNGIVQEVPVRPGQQVAQGQILAKLDTRTYSAALAAAEARTQAATLTREEAQRELDRAVELYDRGQLPDHDKQLAQIALARAEAQRAEANSEQVRAAFRLEQTVLVAPFDAIVVAVAVHPGQTQRSHCGPQPAVVLADAGKRLARLLLPTGQEAPALGGKAQIQIGTHQLEGRVAAIHSRQQGIELEVAFDVPQGLAPMPGTPVEGRW